MTDAIKVDGLRQFQRDLKTLDQNLPKAVRLALNESVGMVVDSAKPKTPSDSGKARGSIKPSSTRMLARVSGGGNRAPYYPWLDFGGKVGKYRQVQRSFKKKGRYIYPAYFKHRDSGDFQESMVAGLIEVAKSAGIEMD